MPLKIAKTPTSAAAVAGVNRKTSCPTGLAIPIAISPARVPMKKQSQSPQNCLVRTISDRVRSTPAPAVAVGVQPAGAHPAGGNRSGRPERTITTSAAIPTYAMA